MRKNGLVAVVLFLSAFAAQAQDADTLYSLSGTVYANPGGTPLDGAHVALCNMAGFRLYTTTANGGLYSFPEVPEGTYHLGVGAQGYVPQAVIIEITENTVKDFTLEPRMAMPGGIAGTVTGEGAPLQMVTVKLYDETGTTLIRQTRTMMRGRYMFCRLAAGTYVVKVEKAGWIPEQATVVVQEGEITVQDFDLERQRGGTE
ncbi:MAG: carboxypeptidase-like regulatory domain-containing protein [Planctomycetota bacterium]